MGQGTVVGEQEQPLAISIEPANRINAGNWHIVFERRPAFGVGELAENIERLEKSNVTSRGGPGHDQLPSGVLTRNSRTLKRQAPEQPASNMPVPVSVNRQVVALGVFARSIPQSSTRKLNQRTQRLRT